MFSILIVLESEQKTLLKKLPLYLLYVVLCYDEETFII